MDNQNPKYPNMWSHIDTQKQLESKEDLLDIGFIQCFERYEIQSITVDPMNHTGVIRCQAYDNDIIVKPYNGKYDWELLLRRLERCKHGVFTPIVRR